MSNNLLKSRWVQVQPDDARIINSNTVLERRFHGSGQEDGTAAVQEDASLREASADGTAEGFQSGLDVLELAALTAEEGQSVIKAAPPEPVYEGPSPEELIAKAQEEIEQMQAKAQEEIEQLQAMAIEKGMEEGRSLGYKEGAERAQAELEKAKSELENDYRQKIKTLEPEFIKQLSGIYEHIFHVELGSYHNLVVGLLESCMQKMESSSSYMIHVSREDYPYVSMQKKALADALSNKNAVLEVAEDASMRKNECMIEADSGIYDCSLDMQLDELRRELMLLSYEGAE